MAWLVGIGIFVLLLIRFPRQVGAVIGIALLGIAGLALYSWVTGSQADRQKALIVVSASVTPTICSDPKYPISVQVQNHSNRVLNSVSFLLQGFVPGHSNATATDYLTSDLIVPIGLQVWQCWNKPWAYPDYGDPKTLQWHASVSSVDWAP